MKALSVNPLVSRFKMDQEEEFRLVLDNTFKYSHVYEIQGLEDVLLDAQGRICSGSVHFRYTHLALYQLCCRTGTNLYSFIRDVAGVGRKPDEDREEYSFDEAVGVLNQLVRRRFASRLAGLNQIRNLQTNTIDGFFSKVYQWLPNVQLYERTKEAAESHQLQPVFYEAVLNGRWMLLRYASKKPYFKLQIPGIEQPDNFYAGLHFSNDEVGQAAVRGATLLLRGLGRTAGISEIKSKAGFRHQGYSDSFETRLNEMLANASRKLLPATVYQKHILELRKKFEGLGYSKTSQEETARAKLAAQLQRSSFPRGLARRAVDSAASQGSYDKEKQDRIVPVDVSVYDLYNALGREAKVLSIRSREALEQLAYQILLGKVTIP